MRLVLKERYPGTVWSRIHAKDALEAVRTEARQPLKTPTDFYQRILTECWREVYRVLKPAGILGVHFSPQRRRTMGCACWRIFRRGLLPRSDTSRFAPTRPKGEGAKPGTFGSQKIDFRHHSRLRKAHGGTSVDFMGALAAANRGRGEATAAAAGAACRAGSPGGGFTGHQARQGARVFSPATMGACMWSRAANSPSKKPC